MIVKGRSTNFKKYLSSTPVLTKPKTGERLYLYLAAIPAAISSVFLREEGRQIPKFQNEQLLGEYIDFLDEERERAQLRTAAYQQRLVFTTPESKKEHLQLVTPSSVRSKQLERILGNWEGPYRIRRIVASGSYKLESLGGHPLPRVWNSDKNTQKPVASAIGAPSPVGIGECKEGG
jgi:hypothetical protein